MQQSASVSASARLRYWLSRIATAIFVPLLLVTAVEFALRALNIGTPTGPTRACVVNGKPAACDNTYFTRAFFPPGMLRTPRPYAIPQEKPSGTYRIIVLGESAAYGDPDAAYAFSRYLEVMLRDRYPDRHFEVINTGITAINSHVIVSIAKDMARYKPDLFIVYAGNNEVVGPFGPGTVFTSSAMSRWAIRTMVFVRTTRLGQLIDSAMRTSKQPQQWRGMEMFLSRQVPQDSPAMQSVYENFEANVRDIVNAGNAAGAKVVVSSVATNLKDCAPFASTHKTGLSDQQLQSWSAAVEQGVAAERLGDHQQAIAKFKDALEIDPKYAETEFRLGRALYASGDYGGAREHFVKAQDLDSLRFRADSRINAIIRSVAENGGDGVTFVDSAGVLASDSEANLPGWNVFFEHVHMTPHGNYVIAATMLPRVVGMLSAELESASTADLPDEEACNRALALTAGDKSRLASETARRMQQAPFTNQLNHDEELEHWQMMARTFAEPEEFTAVQYQWALRQHPEDHMLHLKYGMFLGHINREMAIEELRRSRPYDDIPFVAPDGTLIR
jgi:tetratricopeptide (TPR) repeat protein